MGIRSYDVVESVTDEVTKQFPGVLEIQARKDFLKRVCEDVDALIERTEAESFSVDIDGESMDILLCVSCPEIIARDRAHPLYQVLMNVKSFSVKKSPDVEDGVELQFRTQGIWGQK